MKVNMKEDQPKPDEESIADERVGKRPSDFVEEKLQAIMKGQSLPVSSLRNRQNLRPHYHPTRRSRS